MDGGTIGHVLDPSGNIRHVVAPSIARAFGPNYGNSGVSGLLDPSGNIRHVVAPFFGQALATGYDPSGNIRRVSTPYVQRAGQVLDSVPGHAEALIRLAFGLHPATPPGFAPGTHGTRPSTAYNPGGYQTLPMPQRFYGG